MHLDGTHLLGDILACALYQPLAQIGGKLRPCVGGDMDMVVYRALYGEFGLWVRPAAMWNEIVERDGKTYRRFTYLGNDGLYARPFTAANARWS